MEEQIEIADYLDAKCAEIDSIIAAKKEQLTTLADYKKSLIYEYVTGKKEV
jgi:type I restriction enzyme S subunit